MGKMSKIKIVKDELVYDGQFKQMIRRHFIGTNGQSDSWDMVKRKTYGRAVCIAAVTSERELILIKIFRIPLQSYILEFPAGLMDKQGEAEEAAARRELLEETGYEAERLEFLVSGPSNASLLADETALYLGINARFVQPPHLESHEDIKVVKVPIDNLMSYLDEASKKEMKIDIKLPAILPFLEKFYGR